MRTHIHTHAYTELHVMLKDDIYMSVGMACGHQPADVDCDTYASELSHAAATFRGTSSLRREATRSRTEADVVDAASAPRLKAQRSDACQD